MVNRRRSPVWLIFGLLILSLGCAVPVHAGSSVVNAPDEIQTPGLQIAPVVQSCFIVYRAHGQSSGAILFVFGATSTHSAWAKLYAYCGGDPVNKYDPTGLDELLFEPSEEGDLTAYWHVFGPGKDRNSGWLIPIGSLGVETRGTPEHDIWTQVEGPVPGPAFVMGNQHIPGNEWLEFSNNVTLGGISNGGLVGLGQLSSLAEGTFIAEQVGDAGTWGIEPAIGKILDQAAFTAEQDRERLASIPGMYPIFQEDIDAAENEAHLTDLFGALQDVAMSIETRGRYSPRARGTSANRKSSVAGRAAELSRSRLPRTRGTWNGTPGESGWLSSRKEVRRITKGKPVPFEDGRPDFSKWSKKGLIEFEPGQLTGTKSDFGLVYAHIRDAKGLLSLKQAQKWLSEKGLTPHHLDLNTIQLVPTPLHDGVPHIGSASDLRGGD